jgi:hypothetical protein
MLEVEVASSQEFNELKPHVACQAAGYVHKSHSHWDYFLADTVSGNDRDLLCLHA